MNDSLFSVRNELPASSDDDSYVELNPAVMASEHGRKYALSAVCVGPPLEEANRGPLSLEVLCDGDRAVLDAIHQQSEGTVEDECLTVALFSVSQSFLEILAGARNVRIGLGTQASRLERALDAENRSNLVRFLDLAEQPIEDGLFAGAVA